jgi:hypothetical protein
MALGTSEGTEDVMRSSFIVLTLAALAIGAATYPVAAAKTKMGCEIGAETWDASAGKCVPGASKYSKKSPAKTAAKTAAKKPPAKK